MSTELAEFDALDEDVKSVIDSFLTPVDKLNIDLMSLSCDVGDKEAKTAAVVHPNPV